jgi:hypothetical protein
VASTYRLQEQITGMMLGGAPLDRVERMLDALELSSERRAALRLYALSYVDRGADLQAPASSDPTGRG